MKKYIVIALIAVGCFLLGTLMPRGAKMKREEVVVYRDTSYSRLSLGDIKKFDIPEVRGVPSVLYIPETEIRTVIKDSICYVVMDREHKFLENPDVNIWYSGIDPTIDSLQVKRQTVIQKEPWKRHNLYLGAQTGYYSDFRLSVGAMYQYDVFRWLSVDFGAGYDMYLKQPYAMAGLKVRVYSW